MDNIYRHLVKTILDDFQEPYEENCKLEDVTYAFNLPNQRRLISIREEGYEDYPQEGWHEYDTACKHGYLSTHIFPWDNVVKISQIVTKRNDVDTSNISVEEVPKSYFSAFHTMYGLPGQLPRCPHIYGAYLDDDLIAVMGFNKTHYKGYDYQLQAYMNDPEFDVKEIGNMILDKFIHKVGSKSIVVSQDIAHEDDCKYTDIGFSLLKCLPPQRMWYNSYEVVSDLTYGTRPSSIKEKQERHDNPTHSDILREKGMKPMYDCGRKLYFYQEGEI